VGASAILYTMRKFLILILLTFVYSLKTAAYQVCLEGIMSEEISLAIESVSQLKSEMHRPAPTFLTLQKRGEADKKAFIDVMHSFGFYDADVALIYWGAFPDTTVRSVISPGPQYVFKEIAIIDLQGMPLAGVETYCPKIGSAARADVILNAEEYLLNGLGASGYPQANIADRKVWVDQESKSVSVTYVVDPGPLAYFGPLCIQGLNKVRTGYIRRRIMWNEGDLYDPALVAQTDINLQESGLFSYVMVTPADVVDKEGLLPLLIQLEEKRFRHIGAGVSYSTDEFFGGLLQWSHDNLSGWGDALALVGEATKVVKRATLLYAMPHFFGRNQDLLSSTEIRREDAPGFNEREASFLIRLNRKINPFFSFNYGARYERMFSTKSDPQANYHLLSLPIQIRWDTSNRLLNPTHGTTIAYFATPYLSAFNSNFLFFKQELLATSYQSLTAKGGIILAFSAQFGSILGQSTLEIPPPKRFYSGSSTTLRGYRYLTVSPLREEKPIGGRSYMVYQFEPRFRIFDPLYFATFFDMGNVYSTPFPRWNRKLLCSTGVGLRYMTPVGPFRVDVAFPLKKRDNLDSTFQIYASIGQTF
jgi:translocation and assembly module TamA